MTLTIKMTLTMKVTLGILRTSTLQTLQQPYNLPSENIRTPRNLCHAIFLLCLHTVTEFDSPSATATTTTTTTTTSSTTTTTFKSNLTDYCPYDYFTATCPEDSLIIMTEANYGRMRQGLCINEHSIGCTADIINYMDSICSGKPKCQVGVSDHSMHRLQTCAKDMLSYLQASYICVYGYLASYYTHKMGQGTEACPWKIEVKPGQQIQLVLLDFSIANRYKTDMREVNINNNNHNNHHHHLQHLSSNNINNIDDNNHDHNQRHQHPIVSDYCHVYAHVVEPEITSGADRKWNVCAGSSRSSVVYTSRTNRVLVEVSEYVVVERQINFMIKYKSTSLSASVPA
ncbi:hypothetical protein HELRODRAFT_170946 [Helobdella robusta]|uniref:SUEL-type lectin domain-containing protein n=1 Tax=Helobdella robusta TaxID=6412 RepID=T1F3M1_HELRO|nr:hypothetical protein HELRODRAFT_170946 [Helobdella robusta]ESO06911.1 hypothetical protein HELRODRAFT_170946 [Helobdella robusta]